MIRPSDGNAATEGALAICVLDPGDFGSGPRTHAGQTPPINPSKADNEADTPANEEDATMLDGVRRQREHIKALTGEDPLGGGIAD